MATDRDRPAASPLKGRGGRLARNLGWVFSSQALVAIVGIASLAVAARAIGPAALGVLALVEAYVRIFARLFHLEPWQAVIRYGSEAEEREDTARIGEIAFVSAVFDLIFGLVAALLAVICAPILIRFSGFESLDTGILALGALGIALTLRPTGTGILRLFDRFDQLAKFDVAMAVFRLALFLLGYALGWSLTGFVAIFAVVGLIDGIIPFLMARTEMRARGIPFRRPTLAAFRAANPGFFGFVWNSNVAVIFRQLTQRLDVVILSSLVSAAELGFYHVARRGADAALRLGRPINQAIYPEFTRLAAQRENRRLRRIALGIVGGMALVLAVVLTPIFLNMTWVVDTVLGAEFLPAVTVITIQGIAVALFLCGMVLNPAMLSLSLDRQLAWIAALLALTFFAALIPLVRAFGIEGAALSHIAGNTVWLIACIAYVWRATRRADVPPSNGGRSND